MQPRYFLHRGWFFAARTTCVSQLEWFERKGCHVRLPQQRHQRQWLTSSLPESLSTKRGLANKTQIKLHKPCRWHHEIHPIPVQFLSTVSTVLQISPCLLHRTRCTKKPSFCLRKNDEEKIFTTILKSVFFSPLRSLLATLFSSLPVFLSQICVMFATCSQLKFHS